MSTIQAPTLITADHLSDDFDCGEESLNHWLKKNALKNTVSGASRCYVISKKKQVIGYYSLCAGAVIRESAPKNLQRNMPDSLPIVLIGRLAIDSHHQNQGLGKALLRDAMLRVINASTSVGISAMLVHAMSESAKRFYLSCGFIPSPLQSMTLMIPLKKIQMILNAI